MPSHIWGFGVPPYPTQKGTFHGGVPANQDHYGIQRLAVDSDVHTPRQMVPSGYRVASRLVVVNPSSLRRNSSTCSPQGDEFMRTISRLRLVAYRCSSKANIR